MIKGARFNGKSSRRYGTRISRIESVSSSRSIMTSECCVDMIGLGEEVTGSHGITVKADKVISQSLMTYDLIVIPGGQPGANNLKNNKLVIDALKFTYAKGNKVAAICAGPLYLKKPTY